MKVSKPISFIIILIVVCIISYSTVSAARRKDKVKCSVCPDTSFNLTGEALKSKFKEMVVLIWNQDLALTPLARKFRRTILNLNADSGPEIFLHTTISSIMFNNFAPFMDLKPDACVMAAMANGTLSCQEDHDQTLLQIALTHLRNRFVDINYDNKLRMLMNAQCDYECGRTTPDAVRNRRECYENGYVYPIEDFWSLPMSPMNTSSPKLRDIVFDLYKSDDFVDNFIAACTTFSLSDVVHRLWAKRNPNYIIEAVVLEFSKKIDGRCCFSRVTRAERIEEFNNLGAYKGISSEKVSVNITQCQV